MVIGFIIGISFVFFSNNHISECIRMACRHCRNQGATIPCLDDNSNFTINSSDMIFYPLFLWRAAEGRGEQKEEFSLLNLHN
jgi:hypothetical protein